MKYRSNCQLEVKRHCVCVKFFELECHYVRKNVFMPYYICDWSCWNFISREQMNISNAKIGSIQEKLNEVEIKCVDLHSKEINRKVK